MNDYYVYVYIDPRDFSEFYYGKGRGDRKHSHLHDDKDTVKNRIINEIRAEGLHPIIKVVAKGLTEGQAFLIEKTLIWKLGRNLANISSGHYAENFRPHKTLHKDISGFDYSNGIYFFNCGDDGRNTRKWEHFKDCGFITAGGGAKYSDAIRGFEIDDIACVYLSKHGYVGIGKILTKAVISSDFRVKGRTLREIGLDDYNNRHKEIEKKEYMCEIEWIRTVDRESAFFVQNKGLFTPVSVRASMENQSKSVAMISGFFDVDVGSLLIRNCTQQVDSAEAPTIAVPPSMPSGSPR